MEVNRTEKLVILKGDCGMDIYIPRYIHIYCPTPAYEGKERKGMKENFKGEKDKLAKIIHNAKEQNLEFHPSSKRAREDKKKKIAELC
jgi:hypothetical protein